MSARQRLRGLVLVDGANELSGPRALWWVARHWPAMRREMKSARGYVHHRLWYSRPWTVGLTTWWEDEAAAYRFAYMPEHLKFWSWAASSRVTRGGWLAVYGFADGGPLWGNGVRSMMRPFERFVPPPTGETPRPTPKEQRDQRKGG